MISLSQRREESVRRIRWPGWRQSNVPPTQAVFTWYTDVESTSRGIISSENTGQDIETHYVDRKGRDYFNRSLIRLLSCLINWVENRSRESAWDRNTACRPLKRALIYHYNWIRDPMANRGPTQDTPYIDRQFSNTRDNNPRPACIRWGCISAFSPYYEW